MLSTNDELNKIFNKFVVRPIEETDLQAQIKSLGEELAALQRKNDESKRPDYQKLVGKCFMKHVYTDEEVEDSKWFEYMRINSYDERSYGSYKVTKLIGEFGCVGSSEFEIKIVNIHPAELYDYSFVSEERFKAAQRHVTIATTGVKVNADTYDKVWKSKGKKK